MSSALFTHLLEHTRINKDLPEPSLEDYDLIPIEQLPTTGSYTQDKINRLIRETFWIDTLGTLEPGGLNKKRYEDVIKPIQNEDVVPFVVPFSKTANIAARIIKKHYKILQQKEVLNDYEYRIITAYSKHKNLAGSLVSSKM